MNDCMITSNLSIPEIIPAHNITFSMDVCTLANQCLRVLLHDGLIRFHIGPSLSSKNISKILLIAF